MSNIITQRCFLRRTGAMAALSLFVAMTPVQVPAANATNDVAELHRFARGILDNLVEHHMRRDGEMKGKLYQFYVPSAKRWVTFNGQDENHGAMWLANAGVEVARARGARA